MVVTFDPSLKYAAKAAGTGIDLLDLGVDASEEDAVAAGEGVERAERDVEARIGVVDGEHVDRHAVVRELPAGAALGRVPARNGSGTANVREVREVTEVRPEFYRRRSDSQNTSRRGRMVVTNSW